MGVKRPHVRKPSRLVVALVVCGLGLALVTAGVGMVYGPAALILCGAVVLAGGALLVNVDAK